MIEIEIHCHNGDVFNTKVDEYDSAAISESINNNENLVVAIGGLVFSRIDIKRIIPIEQEHSE